MKEVISFILILPFLLFFMFQPFHNEIIHLRGMAMETTLDRGIELAAVEGYFTTTIIQEMKEDLKKVGFDESKLEFTGTTIRQPRGAYIQGTIKYPMESIWAMPGVIGEQSTGKFHIRNATQMSEYLVR